MSRESKELQNDIDRINQPHKKFNKPKKVDITDSKFPSRLGQMQKNGITIVSKIAEDIRNRQNILTDESGEKVPVTREDLFDRLYPNGRPSAEIKVIKSQSEQLKQSDEEVPEKRKIEPIQQIPIEEKILEKKKTKPILQDPLNELMPPDNPVIPMPDNKEAPKRLEIKDHQRTDAYWKQVREFGFPEKTEG
jgi:hypothetical protein